MIGTVASIARLHIVAIGALGTLTFGYVFSGERPWLLALLSALDWFVVNLLNRVVDLEEDAANRIPGTELVARHKRVVIIIAVAVLLASLWLVPAVVGVRVAFHALGFAYNWPMLPGGVRIKQLYFFKNTASATGFLLTCFAMPLAVQPARLEVVTIAVAAAFFFLFELSYEVLYDLRDAHGDRLAGIRSYPAVHGETIGWRVSAGLMIAALLIAGAGYALGVLPWSLAVMGAAPLIQLFVAAKMVRRGITSRDCILITWLGVTLLAGYHAWDALGLPGAR
jgi:4-hydroxybenzoate polyprenyltransferase